MLFRFGLILLLAFSPVASAAVAAEAGASDASPGLAAAPAGAGKSPMLDDGATAALAPLPLQGLIVRPQGWQPLPRAKPALAQLYDAGCKPADPDRMWDRLPHWVQTLPLETMLGHLFIIGFAGKSLEEPLPASTVAALGDGQIGGVLFFGYNVGTRDQLTALTGAMSAADPLLPPLIVVDQEGGAVARLDSRQGIPELPSARDLAAEPLADAVAAFDDLASGLAATGFNVNLAPVVDLERNPSNAVIARYGRSFGTDPEEVARYAAAFVDAHHAAGVATALKHFPGHGSSRGDSHTKLIDISATWSQDELEPFQMLIQGGRADMIMVGHLVLDRLQAEGEAGLPASLSRGAISFLRRNLCFRGLVVADDLIMKAVADRWPVAEAASMALLAGSDLVLASVHIEDAAAAIDAIAADAEDDATLREAIHRAFARVALFKLDLAEKRQAAAEATAQAQN